MFAGTLRQTVTLQTRTETQGTTGEVTWSWSDYRTVRAAVEPIRGEEYFAARQLQSSNIVRIRIRYLPSLTTKMRAVHNGRYYEIEAIQDINNLHKEIHLMCREREADGWRE